MNKRLLCVLIVLTMLCGMIPFSAFADVVIGTMGISYVQIDGLDMPVVGELPDREVELIEGSGYIVDAPETFANSFIGGVAWYDVTTDEYMAEGEVFVANHEYYPIIGLKAKAGYQFISTSAITGKTNLCDTINAGGFLNVAESQYITVYLGTMMDLWSAKPLHRSAINTTFCCAYNANGEQINAALEGETVTVRGTPAAFGQEFYGWIIEPKGMDVTHPTLTTMQFTMPAEPVTITASYADITLNTVRLFFDNPVAESEVDFTASNMSGGYFYPGYSCITPEGFENHFFNGVAWWDDTDGRYLKPGDVYQSGHTYQITAVIAADPSYVFASKENLTVTMYPGGDCVVDELYMSAYDSSKHKIVTSGDIIPIAPCFINIQGGTAYDAAGNLITQAIPGTEVTIVADEPSFGFQFDQWMIMGDAEVSIADVNSTTTTFIMPDVDITIFSGYGEAPKVPLESVQFSLYGYYMNANADCLQLNTTSPVNFVQNNVTNLDYIVLSNNASTNLPTETQVTGALRNTAKHWIAFAIEPEFGYSLANLTEDMISISWAEEIRLMERSQDYALIFALAPNPERSLSKNSITVNNGTAYVNDTTVTSAVPNLVVRIEADEPPAGQYFSGWHVLSGNVILENSMSPTTTFVMGLSAVELEPIYTEPIDFIAVQIQEPVAGMTPSYLARFDSENVMIDSENAENTPYQRSCMLWYDVDTEEYLDPATAVFEPGHTYGVHIFVKPYPGMVFALDENGYPAVTGSVNDMTDGVYVEQYNDFPIVQLMLTTSFSIPEDTELAEPVTTIAFTALERPVAGQLFSYSIDWDYMQDISAEYALDGEYTLNGITWVDVTDPKNPVKMIPEVSVATAGHMYRVELLACTTNNRIFSLGEENMPEGITATINGEPCDLTTVSELHPTRVLKLMYYVSAEPTVQWNVVLSDNIGINFVMGLTEADVVTAEIDEMPIGVTKTDNGDGTCTVSVQLSAAQMTDEITLLINGMPLENTYSVRQYADYLLADEAYRSCHELVKAMLVYGGEAQRYFGYNTENLADDGIHVTPAVPTGTDSQVPEGQINGVSYYGASLVYRDKIAVRFYFTGNVEDVTFTAGDKVLTPVAKDDLYYVEVADINPQDLGADIYVTAEKDTDMICVSYSPLSYMVRMYEKESTSYATKALVQALYGYYQAAVNYYAK